MKFSDHLIETSPGQFFCVCFSAEKDIFHFGGKVPKVTPAGPSLVGRSAQGDPLLVLVWWRKYPGP